MELRRSTDGGHTWLPQQSLDAVGPETGHRTANAANGTVNGGAAVADAATGTIFFAYRKSVVSPRAFWTYMVSSTDLVRLRPLPPHPPGPPALLLLNVPPDWV